MKNYASLLLFSSSLLVGMQRPPVRSFPGVPSRKTRLFEFLDNSHIPGLKVLVARSVYRHMCEDALVTQEIWNGVWDNCPTSVALKKLITQAPIEMEDALKKYASQIKRIEPEKLKINFDGAFDSQKEPNTVYVGQLIPDAVYNGRGDILSLMVHAGVQPRAFVARMVYAWVWPQIYLELLKKFLVLKPIDITDKCNNWPLMIAAARQPTHTQERYCYISDVLYALITHGADVNARDDSTGQTPLMLLCKYKGCTLCIDLLLQKGADIEACDDTGKRAIVYAVEEGNLDAFGLLMEHKACTGFMMGDQTLFDLAKKKNSGEIIRRLRIARESHKSL